MSEEVIRAEIKMKNEVGAKFIWIEDARELLSIIDSLRTQLSAKEAELEKARELLSVAKCPNCDGSGAYPVMPDGEPEQCRWCFEKTGLLKERGK
jgi:hypothetical protein